ncbi:MAG: hypothetical protein DU429_07810 [Candidatus Tokpelaia sp.]|nr:MAG: hypothetical protein DU430_08180 [Candidatus Tokpelaia sp.]KAA6205530.1 MAG: hypothetical protein DU429_07810 [Candidatus Tokpelaia sp.]
MLLRGGAWGCKPLSEGAQGRICPAAGGGVHYSGDRYYCPLIALVVSDYGVFRGFEIKAGSITRDKK